MRQLILALVMSAATVAPAHASLVYLNDIEVLDTNSNLVWLAPWVTEGLGPVNTYTQNGWRLPGKNPPVYRSVFHVAWDEYYGGNLNYQELLYFFGDFIEGTPIVGPNGYGTRWNSHYVVHVRADWPPTFLGDDGFTECCASIEAILALEPGPGAFIDIEGGPIQLPESGLWPERRLFLVRDYSVVPIPASAWLLGTGVVGLLGRSLRRRSAA